VYKLFQTLADTIAAVNVPITSNGLLNSNLSPVARYVKLAWAPSILNPAPSAAPELIAPFAHTIFLSSTITVAVFNVTVLP
jgi:hypothetical protein